MKRNTLPVWHKKEEFLEAFKANQVLILVGEPGSGKSTQIPQFVLESESEKYIVACTQPHRVAVMSVSRRVAEEMGVNIGEEVGYRLPFEDCSSSKTVLKYLTDGMLLREVMNDPLLERYNVIILDEAHERTLATDALFAVWKGVLKKRQNLKLVVMSASLEAGDFQGYFEGAPLIKIPGRLHPVEIIYPQKRVDYFLSEAINTVVRIHREEEPGDVLVFLNKEDVIEEFCERLEKAIRNIGDRVGPMNIVPLYSTLPPALQQKIFEPAPLKDNGPPGRKIVVSTNIAETSLTIDGIVYVIDIGFEEQNEYSPLICVEASIDSTISKASANQRSERAGGTQPGKCFRLCTKYEFDYTDERRTPEILRSNLASTILTLCKFGLDNVLEFDYMDAPNSEALSHALDVLGHLGAIDEDGNVTELGKIMSEFPLDPQISKMLVASVDLKCSNEILSISAMLSVPNCFIRPKDAKKAAYAKAIFRHADGDHLTLLNVYNAYKQNKENSSWCSENFIYHRALDYADIVRQELAQIMGRLKLELCSTDIDSRDYSPKIREAILAGYFMQVAHLERAGHYLTVKNKQVVCLDTSKSLYHKPEWVIYGNFVFGADDCRNCISMVTDVRGEWLVRVAPRWFDPKSFPNCEAKCVLKKLL